MRFTRHDVLCSHRLWKERVLIMMPRYAAFSEQQIEVNGIRYSTGHSKAEREMFLKDTVTVRRTPIDHILLYERGVPLAYPNRKIALKVYEDIKMHIKIWDYLVNSNSFLVDKLGIPDIDEITLMREYAGLLERFIGLELLNTKFSDLVIHRGLYSSFIDDNDYVYRNGSSYQRSENSGFTLQRVRRTDAISPSKSYFGTPYDAPVDTVSIDDMDDIINEVRR